MCVVGINSTIADFHHININESQRVCVNVVVLQNDAGSMAPMFLHTKCDFYTHYRTILITCGLSPSHRGLWTSSIEHSHDVKKQFYSSENVFSWLSSTFDTLFSLVILFDDSLKTSKCVCIIIKKLIDVTQCFESCDQIKHINYGIGIPSVNTSNDPSDAFYC